MVAVDAVEVLFEGDDFFHFGEDLQLDEFVVVVVVGLLVDADQEVLQELAALLDGGFGCSEVFLGDVDDGLVVVGVVLPRVHLLGVLLERVPAAELDRGSSCVLRDVEELYFLLQQVVADLEDGFPLGQRVVAAHPVFGVVDLVFVGHQRDVLVAFERDFPAAESFVPLLLGLGAEHVLGEDEHAVGCFGLAEVGVERDEAFDGLVGGEGELELSVVERFGVRVALFREVGHGGDVELEALVVVFHELREVEDGFEDGERHVLHGDGLLDVLDDRALLVVVELGPDHREADVEEVFGDVGVHVGEGLAAEEHFAGAVDQQLVRGLGEPLFPVFFEEVVGDVEEVFDVLGVEVFDGVAELEVAVFDFFVGDLLVARLHGEVVPGEAFLLVDFEDGFDVFEVAALLDLVDDQLELGIVLEAAAVEGGLDQRQVDKSVVFEGDDQRDDAVFAVFGGVFAVLDALDERVHDVRGVLERWLAGWYWTRTRGWS